MKKIHILCLLLTLLMSNTKALAQDPFIGEIKMFAGNFAPLGWAFCNGQLLSIADNAALFSLLGTTYGGDGQTTFALPDLRSRAPMHPGQGSGLSDRFLGEQSGAENVTMLTTNMPAHTHALQASTGVGTTNSPTGGVLANTGPSDNEYTTTPDTQMYPLSVGVTGSSFPFPIVQPYRVVNFVIALQGIYPPRN